MLLVEIRGDQRLKYLLHDRTLLGRAPGNSVQLSDPLVSRHHAEITKNPNGELVIKDLDSTHGTYVDGVRIDECPIDIGSQIIIGATRLELAETKGWTGTGQRWHERLPCDYPVRVKGSGSTIDARSTDLSVGGIRIDLDEPLTSGTELRLSIGFPGRRKRFVVRARVTDNPSNKPGLGLAFLFDTPGQETVVASEFAKLIRH